MKPAVTVVTMLQNAEGSSPGNTSEIQALTEASTRLTQSVDSWNSAYVIFGGLALLVAFWVFFAQWKIIKKSKELSSVQDRLLIAKDFDARGKIAQAQKDAGDAVAKASILEKESEVLKNRTAAAELATAELDAQIQPRRYTAAEKDAIIKACSQFDGDDVVIRSLPYDVEGAVFATSIAELLQKNTKLRIHAGDIGNPFMQNLPMLMDVQVSGPESELPLINALTASLATPRVKVYKSETGTRVTIVVGAKRLSPSTLTP